VDTCTPGAEEPCGVADVADRTARCLPFFSDDGAGDVGACSQFCDCNANCGGLEECIELRDADGEPAPIEPEGKPGLCAYPFDGAGELLVYSATDEPVVILEDCP
jgi:hypothetical protein